MSSDSLSNNSDIVDLQVLEGQNFSSNSSPSNEVENHHFLKKSEDN
jgi:hypothetical protein